MKSVKIFLILSIFFLTPFESFSHGPSRQKVSESIIVNASAETVWDIVKNFKDFKWNEDVKNCLATDNKIGSERTIEFNNGSKLKQKLEKLDDEKLMIGWRVTETDNKMLPVGLKLYLGIPPATPYLSPQCTGRVGSMPRCPVR